jgi:hypothetical protein
MWRVTPLLLLLLRHVGHMRPAQQVTLGGVQAPAPDSASRCNR